LQLQNVRGKIISASRIATQCTKRPAVGAGRTAQAEINSSRIEGFKRSKLLGDYER
jgi:hypothetical protein